jgi:hypothetical protein
MQDFFGYVISNDLWRFPPEVVDIDKLLDLIMRQIDVGHGKNRAADKFPGGWRPDIHLWIRLQIIAPTSGPASSRSNGEICWVNSVSMDAVEYDPVLSE